MAAIYYRTERENAGAGERRPNTTEHCKMDQKINLSLLFLFWPIALASWTVFRSFAGLGAGLGNFTLWLAGGKK